LNKPDHSASRARMHVLLAIPERERTEAEWDELNELEIMLAPGNREGAPDPSIRQNSQQPGGGNRPRHGGDGNPGGGGGHHRKQQKNFQRRRPKGPPQGQQGQG